jgi:hypothetical protein
MAGAVDAGVGLLGVALRGVSPCGWEAALESGIHRGIVAYNLTRAGMRTYEAMEAGRPLDALLSAADAGLQLATLMQACFAAGTKLLTKRGWVPIEQIAVGDYVWSKPENDPDAPGEWKRVEAVFVRVSLILLFKVGGRTIETTQEHPFYLCGREWLPACAAERGDQTLGKDGERTVVDSVERTQRVQTVYNLRVADFHTYFVGDDDWGFSVWAHNVLDCVGIPNEDPETGDTWQDHIKNTRLVDLTKEGALELDPEMVEGADAAYYLINKRTGQILKPGDTSGSGYYGRMSWHRGTRGRVSNRAEEMMAVVYEVDPGYRTTVEDGLRRFLLEQGENLPADREGKRSLHAQYGQTEPMFQHEDPSVTRTTFPFYIFGKLVEGNVK